MNIQILKVYKESFSNVRTHKVEWLRVAGGPIIIWALGALLLAMAYASGGHSFEMHKALTGEYYTQPEGGTFLFLGQVVYVVMYIIAMVSLYINGYRYAILQEGGDTWFTLNLNMRFLKLVLYTIFVSILGGIYLTISAGILIGLQSLDNTAVSVTVSVILGILLGLYAFYLFFRITLYPLVISIDQSEPLKTSWKLMKGNILRFIGLIILVALTLMLIAIIGAVVLGLISWLFISINPLLGMLSIILWLLFGIFMILLSWAVNSKVMGLVYQELSARAVK